LYKEIHGVKISAITGGFMLEYQERKHRKELLMDNAHVSITFRHMDHSDALDQYARKKLEKVDKLISSERTPIFIELVLEAQRTHHHHRVELRVKTPNYDLIAHKTGPEMYAVIDDVIDTMADEIRRAKDKRLTSAHSNGLKQRF
jgi:ribosomal subunit interface protein